HAWHAAWHAMDAAPELRAALLIDFPELGDDLVVVSEHAVAALAWERRRAFAHHGAGLRARRQIAAELGDECVARSAFGLHLGERRRHRLERELARGRRQQVDRGLGLSARSGRIAAAGADLLLPGAARAARGGAARRGRRRVGAELRLGLRFVPEPAACGTQARRADPDHDEESERRRSRLRFGASSRRFAATGACRTRRARRTPRLALFRLLVLGGSRRLFGGVVLGGFFVAHGAHPRGASPRRLLTSVSLCWLPYDRSERRTAAVAFKQAGRARRRGSAARGRSRPQSAFTAAKPERRAGVIACRT